MAKILLAGEDQTALDNMEATLSGEGHEVVTAATGLEAYETTLSENPDLVYLEVNMPIFNGFETCEMIREDPEIPKNLPLVLIADDDVPAKKMEQYEVTNQLPKNHLSVDLCEMTINTLGAKDPSEIES